MGYMTYLRSYTTQIEGEYKFGTCQSAIAERVASPMGLEAVKPAYRAVKQWEEEIGLDLRGMLGSKGFIFEEGRDVLLDLIKLELEISAEKADYTAEFAAW